MAGFLHFTCGTPEQVLASKCGWWHIVALSFILSIMNSLNWAETAECLDEQLKQNKKLNKLKKKITTINWLYAFYIGVCCVRCLPHPSCKTFSTNKTPLDSYCVSNHRPLCTYIYSSGCIILTDELLKSWVLHALHFSPLVLSGYAENRAEPTISAQPGVGIYIAIAGDSAMLSNRDTF